MIDPATDGPAAADGGSNAGPAPAAPAAPAWRDGLDDHARLIETKGWKGPGDVVRSYAALERLLGAERMPVPAPDDEAGLREAMRRLGAPGEADGYRFAAPDGAPDGWYRPDAAARFAALCHEAALTPSQAQVLHDGWVGQMLEAETAAGDAQAAAEAALDEELRALWGSRHAARLDLARRAAARFGSDADIDALEERIGGAALVRLFAAIGEHLGEDALVGAGDGRLAASAADAMAEIGGLKLDAGFMAALADTASTGHGEAKARWRRLHDTAYPGMIGA